MAGTAKYGGMRKGNLKVISARSAASSWKLMLLAPPPASAASNTLASAGTMGAIQHSRNSNLIQISNFFHTVK